MRIFQVLVDSLLPNRSWNRRVPDSSQYRLAYWAVRIALTIVIIFLILRFGAQQHPQLR